MYICMYVYVNFNLTRRVYKGIYSRAFYVKEKSTIDEKKKKAK